MYSLGTTPPTIASTNSNPFPGLGIYSMTFDHYQEVPKSVAEEIIRKRN